MLPQLISYVMIIGVLASPLSAFAQVTATAGTGGATTLKTVIAWMQGLGVLVATAAIMWAAFRVMFQGARVNDVAPVFIGGVLFGSAAFLAGLVTAG